LASNGRAKACILGKIDQFGVELENPKTDFEERLFALKFLLHFVAISTNRCALLVRRSPRWRCHAA
jgi:hypothetical protein